MKVLALTLLLAGCSLYIDGTPASGTPDAMPACTDPAPGCVYGLCDGGTTDICNAGCLGVAYGCVDGHWQEVAWCDPPPPDAASETMTLQQSLASASASCPALTVPPQRTLTIVDSAVTAPPPMTVTSSSVTYNGTVDHVHAEVTDDWGNGVMPSIVYDTDIAYGGPYTSTATGTLGDCTFTLDVTASFGGV